MGGASNPWSLFRTTSDSGLTPPLVRGEDVGRHTHVATGRLPRRAVVAHRSTSTSTTTSGVVTMPPRTMSTQDLDEHIARHKLGHPARDMTTPHSRRRRRERERERAETTSRDADDDDEDAGDEDWEDGTFFSSSDAFNQGEGGDGSTNHHNHQRGDSAAATASSSSTTTTACTPPRPADLTKLGWSWNAWKYNPAAVRDPSSPSSSSSSSSSSVPVAYSVGVGRDITFDAALIARHPRLHVHAFDNTPVAAEFIAALGAAGGVPRRWRWHKLLLSPRDDRGVTVASGSLFYSHAYLLLDFIGFN